MLGYFESNFSIALMVLIAIVIVATATIAGEQISLKMKQRKFRKSMARRFEERNGKRRIDLQSNNRKRR